MARLPHPKDLGVLALSLPPIQGPELLRKQALDYWAGQAEAAPRSTQVPKRLPCKTVPTVGASTYPSVHVSLHVCALCVWMQVRPCCEGLPCTCVCTRVHMYAFVRHVRVRACACIFPVCLSSSSGCGLVPTPQAWRLCQVP